MTWPILGAVQGVAGARMMSTSAEQLLHLGAVVAAEALCLDVPGAGQQRARHEALARVGIEVLRPRPEPRQMELAALDRRNDIGGSPRRGGLRNDDGPGRAQRLGHGGDRFKRLGFGALGEIIAGDGDAQAADALVQLGQGGLGIAVGADRIVGIPALHGIERQRQILDRARQRTQMVEGIDEGKGAGAAQPAVGRLQPEQAAQRGRHADRAVGVRAQRQRHLARGHGGARAARRAAGHARRIVRIARGAIVGVLAGEIVGVLAHVEAAHQDRAGRLELADQRAVALSLGAVEIDLRAGARR